MDIDGIIEKIKQIGVGADMRKVARQATLLKLAANIGIVRAEEVNIDISDCEEVLNETGRGGIEQFISLDTGTAVPWIEYSYMDSDEAVEKIKNYIENVCRDSDKAELCAVKKRFGAPVVAMYYNGNLSALSVKYAGRIGRALEIKDKAIKGLPKSIGLVSSNIVRVYGTLVLEAGAKTTETSLATEMAVRVLESNLDQTEFIAEFVDGITCKISDMFSWADSVGFTTSEYRVIECNSYESDEYFGERTIELFEYNEDDVVDCILLTINDIERANINNIKNCPVIRINECVAGLKQNTVATGLRLIQKKDDISLVLQVEPVQFNYGEEVSEINVSLDTAYKISIGDKVTVYKLGNRLEVERRREDE